MENVMDATTFAIEYYNRVYCEYPYKTLVVTNRAWATKSAVSMEYSGLFTIADMRGQEGKHLAYHETAHQWFYCLVGNDEYNEPWLDEAFARFSELQCLEEAGYKEESNTFWELAKIASNAIGDEMINCAYNETEQYTWLFYDKGSLFLNELMDEIGKDEFLSILSEYCRAYAYKTATTGDFLRVLREGSPGSVEEIIESYIGSTK